MDLHILERLGVGEFGFRRKLLREVWDFTRIDFGLGGVGEI